MGFIRWLLNLLFGSGNTPSTPARPAKSTSSQCGEVADRLDRCADRFANAGDREAELDARDVADDVRKMTDVSAAKKREVTFYRSRGLMDDGRPYRPQLGTAAGNSYVRYGSTVRSGGSVGWRYNNPGYVRCSDRATYYGAIGCDGEYAIFPDLYTGRRAFVRIIREEHPHQTVEQVVRQQMPPAEADAVLANVGGKADAKVSELTDADCEAVAAAGETAVESGSAFDRDSSDAPDWAGEVWDSPATQAMDEGRGTDDS